MRFGTITLAECYSLMAFTSDILSAKKMNGFFVSLSRKPSRGVAKNKANVQWTAVLVEKMGFWPATTGATPEEAIELQRAQYQDKLSNSQPVPNLLKPSDRPMASGKMTRFVTV